MEDGARVAGCLPGQLAAACVTTAVRVVAALACTATEDPTQATRVVTTGGAAVDAVQASLMELHAEIVPAARRRLAADMPLLARGRAPAQDDRSAHNGTLSKVGAEVHICMLRLVRCPAPWFPACALWQHAREVLYGSPARLVFGRCVLWCAVL